jgi:ammonia channel protein AmtB
VLTDTDASYALALLARLLGHYFREKIVFSGAYSLSLPISLSANLIGFLFLLFAFITFNFPSEAPVNEETMNYTSAAIGVIGLLSVVTWFTTGYKHFHGPAEARIDSKHEESTGGSETPVEVKS